MDGTMFDDLPIFQEIKRDIIEINSHNGSASPIPAIDATRKQASREDVLELRESVYLNPPLSAYSAAHVIPYFARGTFTETKMVIDQRKAKLDATKSLGSQYFRPIGLNANTFTGKSLFERSNGAVHSPAFDFHESMLQRNENRMANTRIHSEDDQWRYTDQGGSDSNMIQEPETWNSIQSNEGEVSEVNDFGSDWIQ
ncbi:Mnd2p KNAG_0M02430 [Huiozyma naganishii CBS 8797]|uniref:Uncharacterized protein n=1 Tax=Huiozyma naganishii (strain ATCC MYA-139 / BCRC 22969 / CBS 8797 / KCTC 17520 / NBRC 10181 / NCYC 3082 / Yp74L-3) TaxID=1071383 RepID=J7SBJ5_HUIN7|nr:hypothetical protein KNAG_0M02430 [Kazachstania naganishii CBS 8797]CCK73096.1 hypothetical protein KNAG_0M02430 [Kazachstania naganishii CBS 8797]